MARSPARGAVSVPPSSSATTGNAALGHVFKVNRPGQRHGTTMIRQRVLVLIAATVVFVSAFPGLALAQAPLFTAPRDFAVGQNPPSVAVGDFNGDGVPDLAVANYGSTTVSVLQGIGDGNFRAAVAITVGAAPVYVTAYDFNGDGRADLAVANSDSNTVSVLLSNSDGSFQAPKNFATGIRPWSVAVRDFNGDGRADLAVANFGSTTVSVLLGNGDGTFQAARTLTAGVAPDSI